MTNFFRKESSHPKRNAQRNLAGRTHYVDDGTLRFHKSRVLSARDHDNGLLFSIVTSDALDMRGTRRGFRYVIFDIFGTVLARPTLEEAFRTSKQADKARYAALDKIDAVAHTFAAIDEQRRHAMCELDDLQNRVAAINSRKAA